MQNRSQFYLWVKRHPLLTACGYLLFYLIGFFTLELLPRSDFHIVHAQLDNYIPFVAEAIVPYVLWFLWVPFWFLRFLEKDRPGYWRLFYTVAVGCTVALAVFAVWPTAVHLRRPLLEDDLFTRLVALIRTADTSTNVCPSLHVFVSLEVFLAVFDADWVSRAGKWANGGICAAICASTLLLDQHSVIDLLWGAIMAFAFHAIFNRRNFLYRTVRRHYRRLRPGRQYR